MSTILSLIKRVFPCTIDKYFDKLDRGMSTLVTQLDRIEDKLELEISLLKNEIATYKGMLESIGETIPDMMWYKDAQGRYLYANQAIKDGLLFSDNPIGKTDIELSSVAKLRFGSDNHTFGEKCVNSDLVVMESGAKQRFLESGKVKGKMLYLEVYKAPKFVDGIIVGVVGTGRDMTEYVEAFRANNCNGCHKMEDIFKRYEYGEDM